MVLLRDPKLLPVSFGDSVCAVGNFDGIHRGHRELMLQVREQSAKAGCSSVVVTFEPHTRSVLYPDEPVEVLTTLEEKQFFIEHLGIDVLVCLSFTPELAGTDPRTFLEDVLCRRLRMRGIVLGTDHVFGKRGLGNENFLRTAMSRMHFSVFRVHPVLYQTTGVSSTVVRKRILEGALAEANGLLGHAYCCSVERIRGEKRGRRLGYPTINFTRPTLHKVIPPPGVYAARMHWDNRYHRGILYFGTSSTFNQREIHFEFHDFEQGSEEPEFGQKALLFLDDFLRPDKRFHDEEELVRAIKQDILTCRNFFTQESVYDDDQRSTTGDH